MRLGFNGLMLYDCMTLGVCLSTKGFVKGGPGAVSINTTISSSGSQSVRRRHRISMTKGWAGGGHPRLSA